MFACVLVVTPRQVPKICEIAAECIVGGLVGNGGGSLNPVCRPVCHLAPHLLIRGERGNRGIPFGLFTASQEHPQSGSIGSKWSSPQRKKALDKRDSRHEAPDH